MFYIIALGNPGKEYDFTRHNVGWLMADVLRERCVFSDPVMSMKYLGRLSRGVVGEHEVTLMYPDTYMNNSGTAVAKLVPKEERNNIIVLQDEIALPVGTYKVSVGRGDGGHNGIKSIISSLGTKDFVRVRIGIAPTSFFTGTMKVITGEALPKFVLGRFTKRELTELKAEEERLVETVCQIITHGATVAMNRAN